MLRDYSWKFKYTPDDGDLLEQFYIPALQTARKYCRLTGYFKAGALTLAARGIEGLVRNDGHMLLIVGCTLDQVEIDAIEKGEKLRSRVESHLTNYPLDPPSSYSRDALELMAWMISKEILEVKVAVPCDGQGKPIPSDGIFHEKSGIIVDANGDKLAWTGSLNETSAGWRDNWETINVFTSWGSEPERVECENLNFEKLWSGDPKRVRVLTVPDAVQQDLMRFMPPDDSTPTRLRLQKPNDELRCRVWSYIEFAPSRKTEGECIGEATAAVTPWPHQIRAFVSLYRRWPPRQLIADEVGLGKTIQAGMLIRQAWLSGRAKRILILAPKAVLKQWQVELREKFNLNWPIYDGRKLNWYPSPAYQGRHEKDVDNQTWHTEPCVITSSQLMRRNDRAEVLLEQADKWDLLVLDEAHHARRKGAGGTKDRGSNNLLKLMLNLKHRTQGLVLLTATPMQVHPIEVWDLLNLLGLPENWTSDAFLQFYKDIEQPELSNDAADRIANLFQSFESKYGQVELKDELNSDTKFNLTTKKVLKALRATATIPRRNLSYADRQVLVLIVRRHSPISKLISRNTRKLLRHYFNEGKITTPIAQRYVQDRFVEMSPEERNIYNAVEKYIAFTYSQAQETDRAAVGFVLTVYRRRLASSFDALRETLLRRRELIENVDLVSNREISEDIPDDETVDEIIDTDEVEKFERDASIVEQRDAIDGFIASIDRLPPDTKYDVLMSVIFELLQDGYDQVIIFTQYTDTIDFLRKLILKQSELKVICFSGRGGEVPTTDGTWQMKTKNEVVRRFRDKDAEILLCSDAAAEGLNFQFCGAIVNYDMPWNPMRVEQRIGRIDRLGQEYDTIRIVNLHYENTVETDIYRALNNRINLFESVVGHLQPILARLSGSISNAILAGESCNKGEGYNIVESIEREEKQNHSSSFDIDRMASTEFAVPERCAATVTMDDLDRLICMQDVMPENVQIRSLGHREYEFVSPVTSEPLRVTTDPVFFAEHSENVELWSPGSPLFYPPEFTESNDRNQLEGTLRDILDRTIPTR